MLVALHLSHEKKTTCCWRWSSSSIKSHILCYIWVMRGGGKFEESNMERSKQRKKSDTLSLLDYLGGMWASRNAFSIKINKRNFHELFPVYFEHNNVVMELLNYHEKLLFTSWIFCVWFHVFLSTVVLKDCWKCKNRANLINTF